MSRGNKKSNKYGVIGGLRVSKHAHERMKSREISIKEVKKTLGNGIQSKAEGNRTYVRSHDGILVVVDYIEHEIITAVREFAKGEGEGEGISLLRSELKRLIKIDELNSSQKIDSPEILKQDSEVSPEIKERDSDFEISLEDYLKGRF